ncbi:GNAT family N-acetyltransferase [Ancylobacter oerskovii]|uniref:GNAT family N-acetyltransferase n=1 Tax=Ancylobacter oerskovii TaxID=459519 RepID=A0ABW4YZH8_9HYPH|nr:GNAT family N-acetyltransferase [Ancylobacter oerskovii]MBS7541551.1 GNAT family N-acetyltransferase [Ancylobacter oerskovii]
MSARPAGTPAAGLRPFLPSDTPTLASILSAAIFELTSEDYDPDQQDGWAAAAASDEEALAKRLASSLTLVAERDGEVVGFIALADNKLIDLLYVHPKVAGKGVAALLCDAIERLAAARGATSLIADASDTALGFFQKRGYVARQRNSVLRGAVWLGDTTVEKQLGEPAEG